MGLYDQCWIWTGATAGGGYGQVQIPGTGKYGKRALTHRLAYEALREPIPEGLTIDHLYRHPPCYNPWHLEPVTMAENIRRAGFHKRLTHCRRGHPLTPDNLYIYRNGRQCKTCVKANSRRTRERRRAA